MAREFESSYVEETSERCDRFRVSVGRVEAANGRHPLSFVRINPGVCVLAFVEGTGDVLVCREMRHAVGGWQDELPAGGIEPGETPAEAAQRELLEETGHEATSLTSLGSTYPSFGSTDEEIFLFEATCTAASHGLDLDPGEELSCRRVPYRELLASVASDAFRHGAGMAAICRHEARRLAGGEAGA